MTRDIALNERIFLGCLLRSPHEICEATVLVKPHMMTAHHHQHILAALDDLSFRGRPINTNTILASEFVSEEYENIGPTIGVLATYRENAMDAGSSMEYVHTISELYSKRRIEGLGEIIRKALKSDKTADDIAAEIEIHLHDIRASATELRPVKLSDITKRVVTFSERARTNEVLPGFTTGLAALDEITGLLMGGDFIGIIGALGDGKSALLTQIGVHIARNGPVLAAHNEMSEEQNGTRAIATESGMSVRQVREGAYDFTGAELVKEAQNRIERLNYHLYTDPRMTVRGIRARAIQMKRSAGLSAITIDGLKRIRTETRHRDRWDRLEEITGELKATAIELNVPILLAVQRTRTARRRDDPVPQLDDADAPTLETDSDVVLGVFREESWLMMNKPNPKAGAEAWDEWEGKIRRARGIGKIIGLKVRSGKPFEQREFRWVGSATRFEDL